MDKIKEVLEQAKALWTESQPIDKAIVVLLVIVIVLVL